MKYMGSKNRISKHILKHILKDRKPHQYFVEPFCGGCNVTDKVTGPRIANDIHYYLIEMWKALVHHDWIPPSTLSFDDYKHIQNNKDDYDPWLVGYVGFNSYGGKWFGGYCRDSEGKRDYWREHFNNIMKQVPKLHGVRFYNQSYDELHIPPESVIYCDPPYNGTTNYKDTFDHGKFWEWVDEKESEGHTVFVSEYTAPVDFKLVWQKEVHNTLVKNTGSKTGIEKLFTKKPCN